MNYKRYHWKKLNEAFNQKQLMIGSIIIFKSKMFGRIDKDNNSGGGGGGGGEEEEEEEEE